MICSGVSSKSSLTHICSRANPDSRVNFWIGLNFRDRLTGTADQDLLAAFHVQEQLGQIGLGVVAVDHSRHLFAG
jgi:hypothetical protein